MSFCKNPSPKASDRNTRPMVSPMPASKPPVHVKTVWATLLFLTSTAWTLFVDPPGGSRFPTLEAASLSRGAGRRTDSNFSFSCGSVSGAALIHSKVGLPMCINPQTQRDYSHAQHDRRRQRYGDVQSREPANRRSEHHRTEQGEH